jgi:hypothetical protein
VGADSLYLHAELALHDTAAAFLGCVGIHREFITAAARWIMAAKQMLERGWQARPRAARVSNPQHRLRKQSVVPAAAPRIAGIAKTMRLHLRPLGVSQNEIGPSKARITTTIKVNREPNTS